MLKIQHIKENWESFYQHLDNRISGVKTGLPALDNIMFGLRGITVIGGPPKSNKSTLALQIARYYAENNGPVFFYDLENGINRLRQRMVCQIGRISEEQIILMRREKNPKLIVLERLVQSLPFFIISSGGFLEIREVLERAIAKKKKPLLVVDSIQSLRHELAQDRRASIDTWIGDLDSLKVQYEHQLKIIIVSEKGYRGFQDVGLGTSKDSSAIEYKGEALINMMPDLNDSTKIICFIAGDRDGVRSKAFQLKQVFSEPINERSFCYLLEGVESV